jgi:hypothetical protein
MSEPRRTVVYYSPDEAEKRHKLRGRRAAAGFVVITQNHDASEVREWIQEQFPETDPLELKFPRPESFGWHHQWYMENEDQAFRLKMRFG